MFFRFVFDGGGGVIYAITGTGELLFYKDEARNGNGVWAFGGVGKQIGQGWTNFQHVFGGDNGIIYAIDTAGRLLFYQDEARDGNGVWAFGGVGKQIGQGWLNYQHVFSGGNGIIYAIDSNGNILFYKDEAQNGNGVWAFGGVGKQIGQGWTNVRHVFSGGDGIIYAVDRQGNLLFYCDEAKDGNGVWAFGGVGQQIGQGWTGIRQVFSGGDGIIYVVNSAGQLLYYRDEARNGTAQWSYGGAGKQIGQGWEAVQANFQLTTTWAACLSTFTGAQPAANLTPSWLTQALDDSNGVVDFFNQMSGGRQRTGCQVFGPVELMTIQAKVAADQGGTTIASLRTAAQSKGIPVQNFDHVMWLLDDGVSTLATTPSDSLMGAFDFVPQTAMHELTHTNGVCCHADRFTPDDYGDTFCVMGASRAARGFADPALLLPNVPQGPDWHAIAGPGLCTPYLFVAGWLDVVANTTALPSTPRSGATFILNANQGAPPFGSDNKIALTLGGFPTTATDPPQFWVEYRHPSGFDSDINRPGPHFNPDLPAAGVLIVRTVQILNPRCPGSLHSYLQAFVGAAPGNTLVVTGSYSLQIVNVNPIQKTIEVKIL